MKKANILTGTTHSPVCDIKFDTDPGNTHISQIMTGFKLLDNQGVIKIKKAEPVNKYFRQNGLYEHNSIVEVKIDGHLICYDMADGYQSIHRKDVFDQQLDRLDFYFKRSYLPSFHEGMKNKAKMQPLGLNYLCSCKHNPYDNFVLKEYSVAEAIRFLKHIKNKKRNTFEYTSFESNQRHYNQYNLLYLTRLWNGSGISQEYIKKVFPYLDDKHAHIVAEEWKNSLNSATKNRIEYIKHLKEHFGDRVIAGVSRDAFSEKICPQFILPDEISNKRNFMEMIKQNYICITSEGLHRSIGWKFAEYVAAGKAIISEPLAYVITGDFKEGQNYLAYNDLDSCINACERLINDTDKVIQMEKDNFEYYKNYLAPDKLVLNSLMHLYK